MKNRKKNIKTTFPVVLWTSFRDGEIKNLSR